MPCFHPLKAWRSPLGVVALREPLEEKEGTEFLLLPCGTCIGCRKSRAREWALRCQLELQAHDHAAFVTLTYDETHVPPTLVKTHLSKYIRSLRKRSPEPVRFFASGEYGERTDRPHYHAIVFGLPENSALLSAAWPYGHVHCLPVNEQTIAYTAGYCSKKVGWKLAAGERINYATGEVYDYQPPFILMSRNPGLANNHKHQNWRSWRTSAIYNGLQIPVPRYLHDGYQTNATPQEIQNLEQERKLKPRRDTSKNSLAASEAHAIARHKIGASRRHQL